MSTDVLISQPTAEMTRKQFWGNISKGVVVLCVWAVGEFTEINLTAVVAATVTMMVGSAVGYFVKDRLI